ncbi:hypothetical protein EDB85DRAFT_1900869 [Lactarius pseudohatsudake]|nr:hypothetical protein EDB85DRAFT_1900869 [Lactarius pseudohatsudake]
MVTTYDITYGENVIVRRSWEPIDNLQIMCYPAVLSVLSLYHSAPLRYPSYPVRLHPLNQPSLVSDDITMPAPPQCHTSVTAPSRPAAQLTGPTPSLVPAYLVVLPKFGSVLVQAPSPPNPNLNFVEFSEPELEPDPNLLNAFGRSPVIIVVTVVADVQESAQTSVPKTVWHRRQRPTENDEICTIVSGQMYKKVLFPEQMLEVLQHVAKIPRERLEVIERGFQGDVTTKNLCDGPPTPMKGEKFQKLAWLGNGEAGTHDPCEWIEAIERGVQGDVSFLTKGLRNWDESPRERIEAIERGVQGDVSFLTKGLRNWDERSNGRELDWEMARSNGREPDWEMARRARTSKCRKSCNMLLKAHVNGSKRSSVASKFTCVPTKIRATGMDSPKATQDVEDGGNSEDSQRMDGFVGRCLGGIKSVVEIVGGQMYKKVLFAEQKSEVLQHAAKSLRKRNEAIEKSWPTGGREMARQGRARTSKSCNMLRERIEATKKVRQENGEAGAGTYEQMSEVLQHAAQSWAARAGKWSGAGTHEQSEQWSEVLQHVAKALHERIEAIEREM